MNPITEEIQKRLISYLNPANFSVKSMYHYICGSGSTYFAKKATGLFKEGSFVESFVVGCGDETEMMVIYKFNSFIDGKDVYLSMGRIIGSCDHCECNRETNLKEQLENMISRGHLSFTVEEAFDDMKRRVKGYWDHDLDDLDDVDNLKREYLDKLKESEILGKLYG